MPAGVELDYTFPDPANPGNERWFPVDQRQPFRFVGVSDLDFGGKSGGCEPGLSGCVLLDVIDCLCPPGTAEKRAESAFDRMPG